MRTRLVIPAALLVAAAYIKGRQDAQEIERPMSPPACELSDEIRGRAEAEAADAMEILGEHPAPAARASRARADLAGVVRALVPDEPVPPKAPVGEDAVARAASEVAAVASPPAPRPAGVFDPWIVPEFPVAPRARRVRVADASAPPPVAPAADAPPSVPVGAPPPPVAPAPVAAVEPEAAPDLAVVSEWGTLPAALPAPSAQAVATAPADEPGVLSEWATHVVAGTPPAPAAPAAPEAAEVEVEIDESGRFSLGGWAAQAGHMILCGVTFRDRRTDAVAAGDIRLVPDATANVAEDGLIVLGDAGFAPDRDGFTLLVAAAGPGAFAANGRYEVVAG